MTTAYERETTINASDGDELVTITTFQRRYITRLRKNPKVTEVASGTAEGTEWAKFTVPASEWNPVSGVKRTVNMTPEARQKARERLEKARNRPEN